MLTNLHVTPPEKAWNIDEWLLEWWSRRSTHWNQGQRTEEPHRPRPRHRCQSTFEDYPRRQNVTCPEPRMTSWVPNKMIEGKGQKWARENTQVRFVISNSPPWVTLFLFQGGHKVSICIWTAQKKKTEADLSIYPSIVLSTEDTSTPVFDSRSNQTSSNQSHTSSTHHRWKPGRPNVDPSRSIFGISSLGTNIQYPLLKAFWRWFSFSSDGIC